VLDEHDAGRSGRHPLILAWSRREHVHFSFPKSLVDQSYLEVMSAIPFVKQRGLLGGSRRGPFLFVPQGLLSSPLMGYAAGAAWGFETEVGSILTPADPMMPDSARWYVRDYFTKAPVLAMELHADVAPSRPSQFPNFAAVAEMLTLPVLTKSAWG